MITRANDRALRAAFKSMHSQLAHETGLPDRWCDASIDVETAYIAAKFCSKRERHAQDAAQYRQTGAMG